ncbi:ErfK/YbiS/YcfS/YnhG [Nostoc sp. NIES-3756]|uniref:L,D-transpeptidase n=1 Tax=Nostoc sp. NIES-3756 TaxID=1751286 RepID=UPI000721271B|nr:L,D-transpeptidase [Nostoc sp. NIES-3756]BAT54011.1 ErfK/YbiS/YcfS/YnhG [Nostoc sp. NIES-3756]
MENKAYQLNLFKLGLTTILILFSWQLRVTAQNQVEQRETTQVITNQGSSNSIETNYSPKSSTVDSGSERVRTLLMRLKLLAPINSPQTKPNPVNTSEQNIHLRLVLKERRIYVYQGNVLQASYPVAIGKPGWETPTGKFTVMNMVENPAWENPFTSDKEIVPPGVQNPLGERWIGFWTDGKDEIGFHGTYKRDSVGKAISHGCVRMYNEDIRSLYKLVKIGTIVNVVP